MPYTFTVPALASHFRNTPNPPGANALIDLPGDRFLSTEEEIHVIAAALWMMSVAFDRLEADVRPSDKDEVKKVGVELSEWVRGNMC
jgi:hypothetical protein